MYLFYETNSTNTKYLVMNNTKYIPKICLNYSKTNYRYKNYNVYKQTNNITTNNLLNKGMESYYVFNKNNK